MTFQWKVDSWHLPTDTPWQQEKFILLYSSQLETLLQIEGRSGMPTPFCFAQHFFPATPIHCQHQARVVVVKLTAREPISKINYQFLPCTKHSFRKERIASNRAQKIQDNTVTPSCNLDHFPTSTLIKVQLLRRYLYLRYIFTLTLPEEAYGISHCPAGQK